MKYLFFIGLFLLLELTSCKKDIPKGYDYYEITSQDLQNCFYKTNSYWVYIDSVDNSVDSIYIIDFNHSTINCDPTKVTHDIYSFKTKSSYSLDIIEYIIARTGLYKGYTGEVYSGTCIYDDYDNTGSHLNRIRVPSIYIYDRLYENVSKLELENDDTENNNKSIYYINSDFGILKHEIYDDTVLISQKILMRKNIIR